MPLRPHGTHSRPSEGTVQRNSSCALLCVCRRCVQLWCCLTCCRPWGWCSAGQMLCAPQGIQPSPPRISWPNVLGRGYRWSSCIRTNSLVSNHGRYCCCIPQALPSLHAQAVCRHEGGRFTTRNLFPTASLWFHTEVNRSRLFISSRWPTEFISCS